MHKGLGFNIQCQDIGPLNEFFFVAHHNNTKQHEQAQIGTDRLDSIAATTRVLHAIQGDEHLYLYVYCNTSL